MLTAEKAKVRRKSNSNRGSKPGERRGGRQKGTPNKATADIKALAQKYAPDIMTRLHQIAMLSDSDAASVAASKELLDRGYGKSKQSVEHSGEIATLSKEQRDAAVAAASRANG